MKDTEIFAGKNLTDLLQDVHTATLDKRGVLKDMIADLRKMINSADDAVVLAPIIKEYLDVLVRSDDHMLKIAAIVQRIITADAYQKSGGDDFGNILTDAEREQLLAEAKQALDVILDVPPPPTGSVTP